MNIKVRVFASMKCQNRCVHLFLYFVCPSLSILLGSLQSFIKLAIGITAMSAGMYSKLHTAHVWSLLYSVSRYFLTEYRVTRAVY